MTQDSHCLRLIPTKHPHIFDVQLSLEGETRYIGRLDISGTGTFHGKRSEKHLHRKLKAWGLNLELLQRADIHFKWIVIDFPGRQFVTSRMFFLYHGSVFNYGNAGFEKQCFLNLDLWGRERAESFERTLGTQGNLFQAVA